MKQILNLFVAVIILGLAACTSRPKAEDKSAEAEVTDEVVEQFCNDMRGKEKNLFIETDDASVTEARKTKEEDELISQEKLDSINQNIDNYPINEVMNSITNEEKNDN